MGTRRRRSASELARDRRRIADFYLSGWLQADIAVEVGVDQSTISRDLKALQKDWLNSALIDYNAAKARELAKIDRLEREYWAAWEASKEDRETQITEKIESQTPRSKAQIRREGQVGSPSFLAGVEWCIKRRCKMLGLDAPAKVDMTSRGEQIGGLAAFSDEQLDAWEARIEARLAAVGEAGRADSPANSAGEAEARRAEEH